MTQALYEAYATNVEFKNGRAFSYAKFGQMYQKDELHEKAKDYFNSAKILWLELVVRFPSYLEFANNLEKVQEVLKEYSD